jgi:hypothetical protein
LRRSAPDLPREISQLADAQRATLFEHARAVFGHVPRPSRNLTQAVVNMMRTLHDEAAARAPGAMATFLLLGAYALGCLAGPATLVVLAWRPNPEAGDVRGATDRLHKQRAMAEAHLVAGRYALDRALQEPEHADAHRAEAAVSLRRARELAREPLGMRVQREGGASTFYFDGPDDEPERYRQAHVRLQQIGREADAALQQMGTGD